MGLVLGNGIQDRRSDGCGRGRGEAEGERHHLVAILAKTIIVLRLAHPQELQLQTALRRPLD